MAQHFLLSAKARTLSLRTIYQSGEEKAYETFCKIRWASTEGKPVRDVDSTQNRALSANIRGFRARSCLGENFGDAMLIPPKIVATA
jgi:hypothetical protein